MNAFSNRPSGNLSSNPSSNAVQLTAYGYSKLQQLLASKQQEYAQVREHRQVAFELSGDGWHDNPEFNRMQQLEASLNHTVKELTERLDSARLIEINPQQRPTHEVAIGSVVELTRWAHDGDSSIAECWEIVGFDETVLERQQLAYNAPLAAAILGLQVGDVAEELHIGSRVWDVEVIALLHTMPNTRR